MFAVTLNFLNVELVEFWGNIDPHKDMGNPPEKWLC